MPSQQASNLNISNAFSALRAVLAIPVVYVVAIGRTDIAVWICLFATVTDILDGYLARKFHHVTELGKVIDPVADKIYIGALAVTMVVYGLIPLWFAVVVLARDLIIFSAGLYVEKKYGVVMMSNYVGKVAVIFLALLLLLVLITNQWTENIFIGIDLWCALVMMAVSLVVYGNKMMHEVSKG